MKHQMILALVASSALHAATVQVYLAGGQSNATATWGNAIQSTLQGLAPGPVNVVRMEHGGASMWQWSWGGVRRQNYADDLALVKAAMQTVVANGDTPVFSGIFWFQGEGDTVSPATIGLYASRFNDMLGFYRQDLGLAAAPIFTVGVIDGNSAPLYDDPAYLGATRANVDAVRDVLVNLGNQANGSDYDTRSLVRTDGWHLDRTSQAIAGQRMAETFVQSFPQSIGVPETSTVSLISLGLLGAARRRRRPFVR